MVICSRMLALDSGGRPPETTQQTSSNGYNHADWEVPSLELENVKPGLKQHADDIDDSDTRIYHHVPADLA